jgi:pimeloyl-ACP methyl ester carboxylesterase
MSTNYGNDWRLPEIFVYEGQTIRYGIVGDGPPLVLVHGWPFSSVVWRRIIPYLSSHRRIYFYDMLGFGQSDMAGVKDVSLGVQNKILAALLEHWGLEAPDVVGHDLGGATVLRAHLLGKCNYRSLFLIDPVAVAPWGTPLQKHARAHEAALAGLPPYVHQAIVPAYIAGSVYYPLSPEIMALYAKPWLGPEGKTIFYRGFAQMDERWTNEVECDYDKIRCPVMILWGEEDHWLPLEQGHLLHSKIPGSTLKVIPDSGHLMQEDAPEAIVANLLKFLLRKPV